MDVYLTCSDPGARKVCFELDSIELTSSGGARAALVLGQARLCSSDIPRRLSLAGANAPPGTYESVVLHLRRAWLDSPAGEVPLRVAAQSGESGAGALEPVTDLAFTLPLNLRLGRRDAASIFVDWRAGDSLPGGADFVPAFSLTTEKAHTTLSLLYVADAGAGSVLSIDRFSAEVVASFKAGAQPRALALSRDRQRLFVANSGDGSLSVIDVRQGTVETSIGIGLTAGCWDAVLADGEDLVAVSGRDIDRLTLVAGRIGTRVQDIALGRAPTRLAAAPLLRRVYVLESASDAVDVVDTEARTVVGRIPCESRPSDLALDRGEAELYIVHTSSPNLLVVDAASLKTLATIFVGTDVTTVLADRRRDRIYLARSHPTEIVIVERRLRAVVRRIPVSGRIESLAQPLDGAVIYGAAPDRGAVLVIDVVVGTEESPIRCGKRPTDVLVAD